jgi:transcription elongation factor GreA
MEQVSVGATVTLQETETGEERRYTIVPATEADAKQGRISVVSPLGKALLAHEVGDEVTVQVPGGTRCYEIVDVGAEAP